MSQRIRSIINKAAPNIRTIIRTGLQEVTATGRTKASVQARSYSGLGDVTLEFFGHSDIEGVLFGLGPGEAKPNPSLLASWIFARSLNIRPEVLSERIFQQGTERGDFGFVEETRPEILRTIDTVLSSEQLDAAVFQQVNRRLEAK